MKKPWGYHTRKRGRFNEESAVPHKGGHNDLSRWKTLERPAPPAPLGQASFNSVPLVHPDGRPVQAGELIAGRVYDVDPVSGETIARNRAQRRGKR